MGHPQYLFANGSFVFHSADLIEHTERYYEVFCIHLANMYGSHGCSSDVPVLQGEFLDVI
jgi:hypothetical protein